MKYGEDIIKTYDYAGAKRLYYEMLKKIGIEEKEVQRLPEEARVMILTLREQVESRLF